MTNAATPESTDASSAKDDIANLNLGKRNLSPEMAAAVQSVLEEEQQAAVATETPAKPKPAEEAPLSAEAMEELMADAADALDLPPEDSRSEEIATLKDQLMRAVAEMENLRKRTERELADSRKYAVTSFARDLITVAENLQMALKSIPEETGERDEVFKNLSIGIEMTYKELIRIFEGNGIMRVDPMGEKFNHNHHQAVAQVESADKEPGTIVQVLQAGYIIHDRLLRPAMVAVAKAGQPSEGVDTKV